MNDSPKIGMAFIGLGWWGAVLADAALASGKVQGNRRLRPHALFPRGIRGQIRREEFFFY